MREAHSTGHNTPPGVALTYGMGKRDIHEKQDGQVMIGAKWKNPAFLLHTIIAQQHKCSEMREWETR